LRSQVHAASSARYEPFGPDMGVGLPELSDSATFCAGDMTMTDKRRLVHVNGLGHWPARDDNGGTVDRLASRSSGKRSCRFVLALAIVDGVMLICTAAALAAAPTVQITRYSPTVTGTIGTAKAGVEVAVTLIRAGTTIATAPTAPTNANGEWTASRTRNSSPPAMRKRRAVATTRSTDQS
jgi:hypothetical protein